MSRQQEARESFLRDVDAAMVELKFYSDYDLADPAVRSAWIDVIIARAHAAMGSFAGMTPEQIKAIAHGDSASRSRDLARGAFVRLTAVIWLAARRLGLEDEIPF